MTRETIRHFGSGMVLGYIDTESNGDATCREFSGRILGYYFKSQDQTTDFYRRPVAWGNCLAAFLIRLK